MLETVLLIAVVALILVIVVPVGVFIYQRLVASAPAIPSVKAMQQAPATPKSEPVPLPPPMPPAAPAAAPVPASPAEPPPRPSGETRVVLPGELENPSPQATEFVQWYGMLHCTSGPLEGQRFVIEEEGLYIGRDAALSQIVVSDSRVSKRHVRIVPRNGKVMAIDQNSTNGTFMGQAGGQRITEVELKRGDVLVLADNVATFAYQI